VGLADAFIRVQAFGNPGQSGGMRRVCHRRGCRNALLGVGLMPRYGSETGSDGTQWMSLSSVDTKWIDTFSTC
jgi:hypothetical protein